MRILSKLFAAALLIVACATAQATEKGRGAMDAAIKKITTYNRSNGDGSSIRGQRRLWGIFPKQISIAEVGMRAARGKGASLILSRTTKGWVNRGYGADGRADPMPGSEVRIVREQTSYTSQNSTKVKSVADLVTFANSLP